MSVAKILIVAAAALTLASCMRTTDVTQFDAPTALPNRVQPAQSRPVDTTPQPTMAQSADDAIPAPAQSDEVSARAPSPHRDRSR